MISGGDLGSKKNIKLDLHSKKSKRHLHLATKRDSDMNVTNLNLDNIIENIRFSCFSKVYPLSVNVENQSTLMWSHYANNHQGICIALKGESNIAKETHQVRYSDSLEIYNHSILDEDHLYINDLYSKHLCWSYEKEFRHAKQLKELEEMQGANGLCLSALAVEDIKYVFLGVNVKSEVVESAKNFSKTYNIPVFKLQIMKSTDGTFIYHPTSVTDNPATFEFDFIFSYL